MAKILKKEKTKYRKFTIIEYTTESEHYFEVAYGLLRTREKIESYDKAKWVIDYCYLRAENKKKDKAKK